MCIFVNNVNHGRRVANEKQATANLVNLRATSNIEFMLSILARNDTRSERSEETTARCSRNAAWEICQWCIKHNAEHVSILLNTSNCFTFKLSSEQLRCIKELTATLCELSSAAAKNLLALLQNACYQKYKWFTSSLTKQTGHEWLQQKANLQKYPADQDSNRRAEDHAPLGCDYPQKSWGMPKRHC